MRLLTQYVGQRFTISAIVLDNGDCPAVDFLERVKRDDPPSYKSLAATMRRHAECGPIRNERKSRIIKGHEKIFEFKSVHGDRLLYFFQAGRMTLLTNGFHKGDTVKAEYKRAERIRDQYLKEYGNGT
ncbi:MAG: type II toxin-antitoxin system RelE/ParE family toxin [Chloroflexi bacterium]|nr:type II toxin-antitoxin system RelE/ParE family toxin [Chloroflexota bacterium]